MPVEFDADGAPRGQAVLDGLIALLDLEPLEDNLFRGISPEVSPVRVFGGQVAAQALVAAGRTVPDDRYLHSLHAYFLRPGDPGVPIVYTVERLRDGRSFTTRRVLAIQHGQPIFTMSSSFQVLEPGLDHFTTPPMVPAPETLPTFAELLVTAQAPKTFWSRMPRAFDLRHVQRPFWLRTDPQPEPGARSQVWFRPDGTVPDDPLLAVCVLTYLSDLTLLDSVLTTHGLGAVGPRLQVASLDHALWVHRPVTWQDWVLYDTESPSASGGRGLATGRFFDRSGALLATVVQEGLVRLR